MKALALQRSGDLARRSDAASPPPQAVIAQRRSSLGPGSAMAPPIRDAGRPLEPAVRGRMETGFGRDFSSVRVHDDARAHDNARDLKALAYASGSNLVFGEGAYRPGTPSGDALIAHELAHTVQQSGVQMKADGPLPAAADAELERQADRAALDVTSGRTVSGLSLIGRPAVFRTDTPVVAGTQPPAAGPALSTAGGNTQKLPPGMTAIVDDPVGLGTKELIVSLDSFDLPLEKGMGPWVKEAYDKAAAGERLVFSPTITGNSIAAYKEDADTYRTMWLNNFGFTTTKEMSAAFLASGNAQVKTALADPAVAALVAGLDKNQQASGCDIDHIVERQMGGVSIPSNLQLLVSSKNQPSGRKIYEALKEKVVAIRDPSMRGPGVKKVQVRIKKAVVPAGTSDPSYIVENLLRKGAVKGSDAVKAKSDGSPVTLSAGGFSETVNIRDTGVSQIDQMVKHIVPGIKLLTYTRGQGGPKSKADTVDGELEGKAVTKTGSATAAVKLIAEPGSAAPAAAAPAAGGAPAATPATATAPAGESRVLKLAKTTGTDVKFYYPWLSPGTLTTLAMTDKGLTGTGKITPSLPFLKPLDITYGPDLLALSLPLDYKKLSPPVAGFRFTSGELKLTLSPQFSPSGELGFSVGPEASPVINGKLSAAYRDGAFIATGTITPARKLPGIDAAEGKVEYHSQNGWSGKITAATAGATAAATAELGFKTVGGKLTPYGTGKVVSQVLNSNLEMTISWNGQAVGYHGSVTIPKPLPMVKSVTLEGGYVDNVLVVSGKAPVEWRSFKSDIKVVYRRKDGETGKFSGAGSFDLNVGKATGKLNLNFDEEGHAWGSGSLAYEVSPGIKPVLAATVSKDKRIKINGGVDLPDITLAKAWPTPPGHITLIKGVGAKFSISAGIPAVTVFGRLSASAGVAYGVGPVMLKGVKFNGSAYPFEDDAKIEATLSGKLSVPAFGEIYGTFGARIGAEVAMGVVGAEGGIDITPSLRVQGEAALNFSSKYANGGFSMAADATVTGAMIAKLKVDLKAEVYGLWHTLSYGWEKNLASVSKQLGPELELTLGKVAYDQGKITWPSLSQVKMKPENIDPIEIVKDLVGSAKEKPSSR